MTDETHAASLARLGWSAFFGDQVGDDEAGLLPVRVTEVHRGRISGLSLHGPVDLVLPPKSPTGDYAVGDFVLAEPGDFLVRRLLARRSLLTRRTGDGATQLSGANIDTLFIVTSCNADFDVSRLSRYLAMAVQSEIPAVLVLTKADTAGDAAPYIAQAATLSQDLPVIVIDPRRPETRAALGPWFGPGRTVALTGSSGVGKSTLVNTLTGPGSAKPQATGAVRAHDSTGRHTTTARSLHAVAGGGWVLDSPGIRTVHLGEMTEGLDMVFTDITDLAGDCKFSNCGHLREPGCAVRAAVETGTIDPERFARWRKLQDENAAAATPRRGRR